MKVSLKAMSLPLLMESNIKEQLSHYYSENDIKAILKDANIEYKEVIKRTPELGGKENKLIDLVYLDCYIIALYKRIKDILDLQQIEDMIKEGLIKNDFIRKKLMKINVFSEENKKEIKEYEQWCNNNKDKYNKNWIIIIGDIKKEETNLCITRCAFHELCTQEHVLELVPVMCTLETFIISMGNYKVERYSTISKGDEKCKYIIKE